MRCLRIDVVGVPAFRAAGSVTDAGCHGALGASSIADSVTVEQLARALDDSAAA